MKSHYFILLTLATLSLSANAADSMYCPQGQAYINIGMTSNEVIDACGPPAIKRTSNDPVMRNTPVTQLIYSTLNQGAVYPGWTNVYTMWSLPSGSNGINLQVNIMNGKVASINLNGGDTRAMTVCGGASVQIGDDVNKVYSACGSPQAVNDTYISTPVPEEEHPEVWIYQINEYQSPFSLTFVDGKLQSIN